MNFMNNAEICEYKILRQPAKFTQDFTKLVNDQITQGYQPYGSPFQVTLCGENWIYQAVVKYKD